MCFGGMLIGGITQAESPEWIPASSMCSMMAGTNASSPSAMASASTSMAFSRNLSIRMGRLGETSTAAATVVLEHLLVVHHLHGSAAEHERRADHQRVADLRGDLQRLVEVAGHAGLRLRDAQFPHHLAEAIAILGQFDRLGRSSQDLHARLGQLGRNVQRRLSAELDDHALGLLLLVDAQHVFDGQRLEIELVRRIVVGRDGFRVAVDHDRLDPFVPQREGGVDAAIVELDPLADAVRAATQNHHLAIGGNLGRVGSIVGRVVVGGVLHAADGHRMPAFDHSQRRAVDRGSPSPDTPSNSARYLSANPSFLARISNSSGRTVRLDA